MALKVAAIGCGRIAQTVHLPLLASLPGVELAALADPDPAARTAAQRWAPGALAFAGHEELLDRAQVDAAVICTPNEVHAETAIAALEHRRHVYLEKPLATSMADAGAVVEAWRRSGVVAMIGFNFRTHPVYLRARALVASGRLGDVLGARTVFTAAARASAPWVSSRSTGGGLLLRLASHHIDLVRFLLGDEISEVSAALRGADDEAAAIQLALVRGAPVQSFFSEGPIDDDRFEIYGRAGMLTVDRHRALTRMEPAGTGRRRSQRGPRASTLRGVDRLRKRVRSGFEPSYREALARFVEATRGRERVSPDLEDGYRSLLVVEAAEEAARTGRVVRPDYVSGDKGAAR